MSGQADVHQIDNLRQNILEMLNAGQTTIDGVVKAKQEADKLYNETLEEQENSQKLLEAAKTAETAAHAALIAANTAVAVAAADVAAAASFPPSLPAALAALEEAKRAQEIAREAYELAKKHRQFIEKRCELAQQCVRAAEIAKTQLIADSGLHANRISEYVTNGQQRLESALNKLGVYIQTVTPTASIDFIKEKSKKTNINNQKNSGIQQDKSEIESMEQKILKPQDILKNINLSRSEQIKLLQALYEKNKEFADIIDRYRSLPYEAGKTQVCRNVAGRLAEELVIQAFTPYGDVSTQDRYYVATDKYTKIDLLVTNLKLPVVLGRGSGMMAPKGGILAIEVKAGRSTYIKGQKEHLLFQVAGHTDADASCVICTRNIKDIPADSQQELRQDISEAGSRILGMLPTKEELDQACLEFVYNGR